VCRLEDEEERMLKRGRHGSSPRHVVAGLALPRSFTRVSSTGGAWWWGNLGTWFLGSVPAGSTEAFVVTSGRNGRRRACWAPPRSPSLTTPDYTNNVVAASVNVTLGVTPGGSGSGPEATRRSE
jgi:hypothetical protein